jgi:hypothetical protein
VRQGHVPAGPGGAAEGGGVMNFDWGKVKVVEVTPKHLKKGAAEPFVILPLAETAQVATVLNTAAQMFVWIWIVHQSKKRKSELVTVSNVALAPYGISRKVKGAALDHLEAAGLISIEQNDGEAPVVRLLPCKS